VNLEAEEPAELVYSKGRNSHIALSPDEAKQRDIEDQMCDDDLLNNQPLHDEE
jgi:hypothetical protein